MARTTSKERSRRKSAARARVSESLNGTAKGRDTVDAILAAAEEVLIAVGHADFTARKVADKAGIALGNLTYHFPTMKELQRALIDSILNRYLTRWERFRHDIEVGTLTPASLGETMGWLISDAVEIHTTKLFRELWAMGSQSESAAESMDNFYRQSVAAAAKVACLQFPTLSAADATNLAYLMAVISEGSIVLFGTLPEASTRLPAVQKLAIRALEGLMIRHDAAPQQRATPVPIRERKAAAKRSGPNERTL